MASIGCKWRHNKKAWMRHEIMEQWLRTFYLRIGRQRRVLLLMDNFSAHLVALEKAPPPSNIRIVFFPANATSIYQPLDQGIIQNLKHYYRKSWLYWMIGMLDRGIDPRERMSLNYTLRWLTQAWRTKVSNETIRNCYIKSTVIPGCRPSNQDQTDLAQMESNPLDPDLKPLYNQVVEKLAFQPDAEEILPFDEFLNPSDENMDTAEPDLDDIIINFGDEDIDDGLPDPDEEYIFGPRPEVPSDAVILRHLSDLLLWAAHKEGCTEDHLSSIEALTKAFKKLEADGKKQKTLMEMGFKPK
jgi:DDE superfamily endonuclease.